MRNTLLSKINLSNSSLKPYEGFIFLCGGPTDITSIHPVSIRDAIYRELVKDDNIERRIRVAEHYKDWSKDSVYLDLVSFERHLAELSSVIVLVLESPGSIAELGLFSIINEFQSKLLIFIETEHYISDSFIKLGPIDYLEKNHKNFAECHRWSKIVGNTITFDSAAAADIQKDLAEAVMMRARQPTKERTFHPDIWLDTALLLCDLVNLNSALTLREIKNLFEGFGYPKSESEIRQILFILEKVELVAMEPKGDQRFYISKVAQLFLKFQLSDHSFDLDRFRHDALTHYEREDRKRFRAILEARRRQHADR
jgi:hypothetical protein